MAKKISQLTQATEVKSDDVTVIVQDGETKKLPLNLMVTKQDIENKKVAGLAKLDEIEATYENDTYTPTITVKNKSSVKVGEGDGVDYSANVMDGPAKSAILKCQTLVNLITNPTSTNVIYAQGSGSKNITIYNNYKGAKFIFSNGINQCLSIQFGKMNTIVGNKYLLECDCYNGTSSSRNLFISNTGYGNTGIESTVFTDTIEGKSSKHIKVVFTMLTDQLKFGHNLYTSNVDDEYFEFNNIRIIEYQEGMENWDIPYFEGMQSVKMPVLTTTGKNLVDMTKFASYNHDKGYTEIDTSKPSQSSNNIEVNLKPKTTYMLSVNCENINYSNNQMHSIRIYDGDTKIGGKLVSSNSTYYTYSFTTTESTLYIVDITPLNGDTTGIYRYKNMQIEEGTQATSYEPYKSNILTVNEDVELGSVGEVKDEINLLTAQLTQRTETRAYQEGDESNSEVLTDMTNTRYKLPKEVIKTVDLMPSGTHPSTTPYCWKNGHIQLSSSGLLPNLEYSVVTSRAGQINQNATMIVKNDKRIFDLEILLAGGLVNTTYQALTLQNQVETGLSKVSLSSETEPDYLLYHMIMKLIEEKAYKLDDLTEKVSVFYLYEKLSDEQFETIYSELYPFVEEEYIELPEDGEIIEEPIVDEVLEEVENEVVM